MIISLIFLDMEVESIKKPKVIRKPLSDEDKAKISEATTKKRITDKDKDDIVNQVVEHLRKMGSGVKKDEPVIVMEPPKEVPKAVKVEPQPVYKPKPELPEEPIIAPSRYGRKEIPENIPPVVLPSRPVVEQAKADTEPVKKRYGKK